MTRPTSPREKREPTDRTNSPKSPAAANEEIRVVLAADPDRAAVLMDHYYRPLIVREIKEATLARLRASELPRVYRDVILGTVRLFRKCRETDTTLNSPLHFVLKIARNVGVRYCRERFCPDDRANSAEQEAVGLTKAEIEVRAEWSELTEAVHKVVKTMPNRQRLVATAYLAHYEEFGKLDTYDRLAKLVAMQTQQPEDPAAVKAVWREAYQKIQASLAEQGWPFY
jgi:hypothetical protein